MSLSEKVIRSPSKVLPAQVLFDLVLQFHELYPKMNATCIALAVHAFLPRRPLPVQREVHRRAVEHRMMGLHVFSD